MRLADRELDVRVSTVPTMYGESVVLRLLDHGGRPVALDALGMPPDIFDRVCALAAAAGWRPLVHDGLAKVAQGLTTVEEVLRVIQS